MRVESLEIQDRVSLSPIPLTTRARSTEPQVFPFDEVLKATFQNVDRLQKEANRVIQRLSVDGSVSIHQAMIATEKADLSFRLMLQIRNKIIDAYHEVMRMQV